MQTVTYAGKIFTGGFKVGRVRPRRGSGGGAPRTPENFRKFAKNSRRKLLYFRLFCKKISKPCGKFSRVWTKNTIVWEILRKFWKFLMKIQWKNWIISIFLQNLLLKIETSEITSFLYNNFFRFGVRGFNPPPLRTPLNAEEEHTDLNNFGAGAIIRNLYRGQGNKIFKEMQSQLQMFN